MNDELTTPASNLADLADALALAEADLQEAAILMIREPELVALVGRKVAAAISHAHKARQKLARGLNRPKPPRDT